MPRVAEKVKYDGEKLRRLRLNRGWSRLRLARVAGVHSVTVYRVEETGRGHPGTVKKIAEVFGIRVSEVLHNGGTYGREKCRKTRQK